MRRRDFLILLGPGIVAWPRVSHAQHGSVPKIGFLSSLSYEPVARAVAAFRGRLEEAGYLEGQNLAIYYRWANGETLRLPDLVAELVRDQVTVIVATGGGASALAAKAATATIPIVFSTASDPVQLGLVASLNRPSGNATGVYVMATSLEAKRVALLRELVRHASVIALLINPQTIGGEDQLIGAQRAADTFGGQMTLLRASSDGEITAAFATLNGLGAQALFVAADPFFNSRSAKLIELAGHYAVPTIYEFREFAAEGGLMSYGTNLAAAYSEAANYVTRILRGAMPSELPVMQASVFELVLNLKTARALGLDVPVTLLAVADELIE